MSRIDWDKHLEPPEEPPKVCECAACGDDLLAGEDVVLDCTTDLYFCNMGCAGHFVRANPDVYGKGADADMVEMKVVTLEEPEPDCDDHYSDDEVDSIVAHTEEDDDDDECE